MCWEGGRRSWETKGPCSQSPRKIFLSWVAHYRKLNSELKHPHSFISEVRKEINVNLENYTRLSRKKKYLKMQWSLVKWQEFSQRSYVSKQAIQKDLVSREMGSQSLGFFHQKENKSYLIFIKRLRRNILRYYHLCNVLMSLLKEVSCL